MPALEIPKIQLSDGRALDQLGVGTYKLEPGAAREICGRALELGYRHLDTAKLYHNEAAVGEAVAASGLAREAVWVTTKLWHDDHADAVGALKGSLDRLQMEWVDLFLIHWPTPLRGTAWDAWRGLIEAQEQGLAKSIGVSNFEIEHLERIIAETGVTPVVNQIELHPHHQRRELVEFCREHDIAVESWSPLARGRKSLQEDPVVTEAAAVHDKTPVQVLLRWQLQHGFIVFPKTATPSRLEENAQLFDFELSDTEMAALDALERGEASGSSPFEMNG